MIRFIALAPVLVAVLSLTACGSNKIDDDKAETEIARAVRVQAGVPVKSVECPEDVTAKKGDEFECKVTAKDGTTGQVQVVQKDDEGNLKFDAPFIHMDEAEAAIVEQIKVQVPTAKGVVVDCQDIVVGEKGGLFECKGKAEGATGSHTFTVSATQTDGKGRFTFKTQQTS